MNGIVGIMLLVDLIGLAVIGFIVWWFWAHKSQAKQTTIAGGGHGAEIVLKDGVFSPVRVEGVAGQPITLRFFRQDAAASAARVAFDELSISTELPINEPVDVQLPALSPGEYSFADQLNRYRGSLVIK